MLRTALVLTAARLVFAAPTFAQDAPVVDPDHYAVEFENDEVRVLRITYGPHEKSVMHEHPASVAIMLTTGDMLMHLPDGSTTPSPAVAGQAFWTPAVVHQPENLTDHGMEVILVEMKDDGDDDDDDGDR